MSPTSAPKWRSGLVTTSTRKGAGSWSRTGNATAALFNTTPVAALIAVANAALPDDDPRKITRASVLELYGLARVLRDVLKMASDADMLERHAAALHAYLPPETT